MSFEIKLSQIHLIAGSKEAFDNAVKEHINTMHAFAKSVGKPRPTAKHPLIESAIKRTQKFASPDSYSADYTVIDDSAAPPTLEEKKQAHYMELLKAEHAARHGVHPHRKNRHAALLYNEANRVLPDERTPEQNKVIEHYLAIIKKYQLIEMASAEAESAIDDLTDANVDSWKVPPLG